MSASDVILSHINLCLVFVDVFFLIVQTNNYSAYLTSQKDVYKYRWLRTKQPSNKEQKNSIGQR